MTKRTITTFEGWERLTVSGQTGSSENPLLNKDKDTRRWFEYETAIPSADTVERFDDFLGQLDSRRLLKTVYAQLKIQNRPNPLAKAPKTIKADVALARQLELAQTYIANGEDPMTAFRRAANEALKTEPAVEVEWITKAQAEEHDASEKEMLAVRLG